MTISDSVGIGTTNPSAKLHISSTNIGTGIFDLATNVGSAGPELLTRRSRGTADTPAAVISGDDLGGIAFFGYTGSAFALAGGIDIAAAGPPAGGQVPANLYVATNDGTTVNVHLTVTSVGKVGIGTTAPERILDLYSDSTNTPINIPFRAKRNVAKSSKGTSMISVDLSKAGGVGVVDDSAALIFGLPRADGTTSNAIAAVIAMTESISPEMRSSLGFTTGTDAWTAERMHIDSNGNVGIGTTTPGAKLDVAGSARIGSSGTIMKKIEAGTIGTCKSGSAGSSGSVTFPSAFAATPIVIMTVDEPAGSIGCVSVFLTGRSTTGFSWQGYAGGAMPVCDCIHWLAIEL